MKAVLIKDGKGPAEHLYLGDVEMPKPDPEAVLVKVLPSIDEFHEGTCLIMRCSRYQVKAFGLNRMDIHQRDGQYPPPPGASEILGVEFSGIVTELGSNVERWKVGDEVLGLVSGVSASTVSFAHNGNDLIAISRAPMRNML